MLVLGIESSCDETGIALYDDTRGLLAHVLHSQVEVHAEYGGVVPEIASRDHVRKLLPLLEGFVTSIAVVGGVAANTRLREQVAARAREEGLEDVCFMIGGAVVDQHYADEIGAQGYAADALAAVRLAQGFGTGTVNGNSGSDRL